VKSLNKRRKLLAEQLEDRRLLAGPYAPAAGLAGSDAIANDEVAVVGWATAFEDYQPGSHVDPAFQFPANAIGQAEGTTSDAVTLGRGGQITLTFATPIRDGLGDDFAVYENSFSDTFLELAYVEVSSDGTHFFRFENDSLTASPVGAFGDVDPTNIHNLAGKYRRGQGTPFDLEELSGVGPLLNTMAVTHVRLIDVVGDGSALDSSGDVIYDPSPTVGSAGFDLDGVGVLNQTEYERDWVGLEDVGETLSPQTAFNGPDPDGTIISGPYDDVVVLGHFHAEQLTFNNAYSHDFGSWNQWAYSNMTDTVTAGYENQFSAFPGSGASGSETFGVAFVSQGDFYDPPEITRDPADLRQFGSLMVANTTYAALSMLQGDAFAKKFGGTSGNEPDFFSLTIEGKDANGVSIGTVDVFLADYRSADNSLDYVLDQWVKVDLSSIADARSLVFSVNSSDVGPFGINTPSYFAVDEIELITPVIALDLKDAAVDESGGASATTARISRAGSDLNGSIEFALEPIDALQGTLPTSVILPSGVAFVDFPIGVVDNSVADGDREIEIRVTADGFASVSKNLLIRDDDPRRLTLGFSAGEIAEGSTVIGTVFRNDADLEMPLTVQLQESVEGRLAFDSPLIIQAGEHSVSFEIAAPEDESDDPDISVVISADANDYESGFDALLVLDNDTPTLEFSFDAAEFSEQGASQNEGMEVLGRQLALESAYNGSDGAGQFAAGGMVFNNEYNPTYDSWAGWAYSNTTDVTTSGYFNQYSAFAGGGAVGSDTYLVANAYPGFVVPRIMRDPEITGSFRSFDITNTTYAALSMSQGDSFGAKKFGGTSGDDPDFFILTVEGFDATNVSVGSLEFPLADFRFEDNTSDYILDSWTSVDVSSLGDAVELAFSLVSSDIGPYGMNTPAYFALDNMKFDSSIEPPMLTVTRNTKDETEGLLVKLFTSDHSEAVIPLTVVIPAGESSVDVSWEIIDDALVDHDRPVIFTAIADGYEYAQKTILIQDDDSSTLSLTLSPGSVSEVGGTISGVIHRNHEDVTFPLEVSLEATAAGYLDVPASLTIPSGQRSQVFEVLVVDNEVVDDDRFVQVVASKPTYMSGSDTVLVLDDDVEVRLSISETVLSESDANPTVHLEDLEAGLAPESFSNGADGAGGFESGPAFFNNSYESTYGSWRGWSVSNMTDTTTPGYLNQYSSISGDGALGSSTYVVANAYPDPVVPAISVSEGFSFASLWVTNTTYAALSMQQGDFFAKKFGGETGDDPDFLLLTIEGLDSSDQSVGTVDFYLADYRFADNSQDYLVSDWMEVDVSSLAAADRLVFSLDSSDVGAYGINTPAYFALDQVGLADSRSAPATVTVVRSDDDLDAPLLVELSSDPTEVAVPSHVVIPTGSSSVEFPLFTVVDGVDDGDQSVSLVAAAADHVSAVAELTVEDVDSSILSLTLSSVSVSEAGGMISGLIHCNREDVAFPLEISLEATVAGHLDFPATLTIPSGQRSLAFDVVAIDNEVRDGTRIIEISSNAEGYAGSTATLAIDDDEVSALQIIHSDGNTTVGEMLGTDGFQVVLASRPQSEVVMDLSLVDWPSGPLDVTVDQSSLTFDGSNWNVPQVVLLTGVPDFFVESDEEGAVRIRIDAAVSDPFYADVVDIDVAVIVKDFQPTLLTVSEDANAVYVMDETSGVRVATGSHTSGLNVITNDFPQTLTVDLLHQTTGQVRIDTHGGADVVQVNGDHFMRVDGGDGTDRLIINVETAFELFDFIGGRVFEFEEYVLQSNSASIIQVDLRDLEEIKDGNSPAVLTLYVQSGNQCEFLGSGVPASPMMVGGQFAQIIVAEQGQVQIISQRPWQNAYKVWDVDHNGGVTAGDALAVLNHLAAYGGELPPSPTLEDFHGLYPDVSGDGRASALDSLLVLNMLSIVSDAEGETISIPQLLSQQNVKSFRSDPEASRLALGPELATALPKVVLISNPADQAISELYPAAERGSHRSTEADPDSNRFDLLPVLDR